MKVIIAGGRDFTDIAKLFDVCDYMLQNQKPIEVVSGCAEGADKLGERYARDSGLVLTKFPADWDTHGKSAGYRRNIQMAEYADALIAFWDGKSKGTEHMIDLARKHGLQVKVVNYKL